MTSRRWKPFASFTVAIALVGLAGCGSKDSPSTTGTAAAVDTIATSSEAAGLTSTTIASRLQWPLLGVGTKSDRVIVLQYLLVANKISVKTDGNFGPKTLAALKAFQVQQNILVTDATDAQTWTRLATDVTASSPKDQIRALQAALRNNGYKLPISGVLDTATIDFIAKSRADSGSTSTGTFTVADWLTLVGTGD